MPLYEYECRTCGFTNEEIRRMSDADTRRRCPDCRGYLTRVPSVPANAQFKGSGFHSNDYPKEGKTK